MIAMGVINNTRPLQNAPFYQISVSDSNFNAPEAAEPLNPERLNGY
jgi:hypothetical protein